MAGYLAPAAGLFISRERSPRISQQFRRLAAETESLVKWRFVYTAGSEPITKIPLTDPALVMPTRYRRLHTDDAVAAGYLDVAFIPCVLALRARHVWVMASDVGSSSSWHEFFSQFARVNADVLTGALAHQADAPDWNGWTEASAPDWVDRAHYVRGAHPLLRLSRRFAHRYAAMMADSTWLGHYEFTIPTAAVASGSSIEDLGDTDRFTWSTDAAVKSP